MEYTTYASRLRFLGARDVDDAVVDYDGLDVRGPDGAKLGAIDGFIVDAEAARLYSVVVDSGGWFPSRRFLVPIGHASIEPDRSALRVDVHREALSRYPVFEEDRFRQFSDEDLRLFEMRTAEACCPCTGAAGAPAGDASRHYVQPAWWNQAAIRRERLRTVDVRVPPAQTSVPWEHRRPHSIRETADDSSGPRRGARLPYRPGDDGPRQSER